MTADPKAASGCNTDYELAVIAADVWFSFLDLAKVAGDYQLQRLTCQIRALPYFRRHSS